MAFGLSWWSTIPVVPHEQRLDRAEPRRGAQHVEVEGGVEPPPDLLEDRAEVVGLVRRRRHPAGERRVQVVVPAHEPRRDRAHRRTVHICKEPALNDPLDGPPGSQRSGIFRARALSDLDTVVSRRWRCCASAGVARHSPSRSWRAAATAPAVGTRPISPTPLMPYGLFGCGDSTSTTSIGGTSLGRRMPSWRSVENVGKPVCGIGREVLGERVAETHVHAALDLALAQHRVHRPADVVGGDAPARPCRSRGRSTTSWAA